MTPSEILVAAADRVRDLAAAATPGPWFTHDTHLNQGGHTATVLSGTYPEGQLRAWLPTWSHEPWDETRNVWNDAQWIAAMSPAIAPLLETLLRVAAVEEESPSPLPYGSASLNSLMSVARELARQIMEVGTHEAR